MKSKNKNESYRKAFGLAQLNLWLDATNNVFNMKEDTSAVIVFESLKKAINKNIIKQIEDLKNPKRCVLIMGGDYDLVSGVVSYIYYFHTYGSFHHIRCSGLNEEKVESWIPRFEDGCWFFYNPNSPLIKFMKGKTLFLRDLNSEYQFILKSIAEWIRDLPSNEHGMLIISMDNTDNLPKDFTEQFKIIYVELTISLDGNTKTITINNEKFQDMKDREYNLFKLLYENRDRIVPYKEIRDKLVTGESAEQQIFNLVTSLRNTFNRYPLEFRCKKGVGYQLIIQN